MGSPLLPGTFAANQFVNVAIKPRTLFMHLVTEEQLMAVANATDPIDLTFFGIGIGAFVSLLSTVLTAQFASVYTHASFVLLTWATAGMTLFFGWRSWMNRGAARKAVKRIIETGAAIEVPSGNPLVVDASAAKRPS